MPTSRIRQIRPISGGCYGYPPKGVDEVEIATAEWVDWFNHRRLYEYCGDVPPAELEAAYYARIAARQPAELTV